MSGWLVRWMLSIAGIVFTTSIVAGFTVTLPGAVAGSIVLGLINATIRPLLILLTLPISLLTLGLFTLVINGLMLWLVSLLVRGFEIQSFGAAFIAALFLMVINAALNFFVKK